METICCVLLSELFVFAISAPAIYTKTGCTPLSDQVKQNVFETFKLSENITDEEALDRIQSIEDYMIINAITHGLETSTYKDCPYHILLNSITLDTLNNLIEGDNATEVEEAYNLGLPVGRDIAKTEAEKVLLKHLSYTLWQKLELPERNLDTFFDGTEEEVDHKKEVAKRYREVILKHVMLLSKL